MSLYNITQEYQLLVAQLEEQDGEFTEEQLQLLEITKIGRASCRERV